MFRVAIFVVLLAIFQTEGLRAQSSAPASSGIEKLTGAVAREHMQAVAVGRRAAAFAKARELLIEKGWKDTGRVEVIRTRRQTTGSSQPASPYRSVTTTPGPSASSSEGEIITWQWDDGDYTTWEGTIYLHDYASGFWMVVDCQMLATPYNEWNPVWDYPVDGQTDGSGGDPDNQGTTFRKFTQRRPPTLVASLFAAKKQWSYGGYELVVDWARIRRAWSRWAACTASACAGIAVACNYQNPTPQEKPDVVMCTAAWCTGAGMGCITTLRDP